MKKKKLAMLVGIFILLIITLSFIAYWAHETREKEVIANCNALIGKETTQDKEKAILERYPLGKAPSIDTSSSFPFNASGGKINFLPITITFRYWNEVGIKKDFTFATNGFDITIYWKNGGHILTIADVFIAQPDDNCELQIWREPW